MTLFWLSLLAKLGLAMVLPLTNDEAYYWVWAQHLQLSYFDHPPAVAWLYALGSPLRFEFFQDYAYLNGTVRWPGVLLSHATLWLWLRILKPYLDKDQLVMWLSLSLLSPLLGGSGLIITPDVPLLFFYALSLWLYLRWENKAHIINSLSLGLAVGLGFSSKYMIILFILGVLPWVLISKARRQALWRSLPWLFFGFIIGALPVLLWNFYNDFASIRFQAEHGLGKLWKPAWTFHYIGTQAALLFPPIVYWALKIKRPLVFHKVFLFLAWIPVLFFFMTSFRGYVEANWPIVAYPFIFALAVSSFPLNKKVIQVTLSLWAVTLALMLAIVLIKPTWSAKIKSKEFYQFESLVQPAKSYEPLYARSYQMASKLYFELKRPVFKLRGMNRRDFFDSLEQSSPAGKVYYVAAEKTDELPIQLTSENHKIVERIKVDERFEIWKVEVL